MTIAQPVADERRGMNCRSEQHRQALQRLQAKKQIIADLIGGRLALVEASERFRCLSADGCGEEASCRQVIGWANLALGDWPEKAEVFSTRLEAELERYLASHGMAHSQGRGHD